MDTSKEKQMQQRDEWMNIDLDFSTISKKDLKPDHNSKKSQEDSKNKFILDNVYIFTIFKQIPFIFKNYNLYIYSSQVRLREN